MAIPALPYVRQFHLENEIGRFPKMKLPKFLQIWAEIVDVSTSCLFYQRLVNYVEKHRTSNFQVTARDQNMRSSEKPWNLVPGAQKIGFLDEDATTRELRNHTAPNSLGLLRIVFFDKGVTSKRPTPKAQCNGGSKS